MYSVVLLMALSGGVETPAADGCAGGYACGGGACAGGYGCNGGGCHGGRLFGGHGCHGGGLFSGHGCHGRLFSGHGCHGGSSCAGYSGCSGCAGCSGGHRLFGGGLFHRCNGGGCNGGGCHGGCYGGGCAGGGCYGGGCAGGVVGCNGSAPATAPAEAPKPMPAPKEKGKEAGISAPATIIVSLPADAKLKVDDYVTTSTSATRVFVSPTLAAGKEYSYTLTGEIARENGNPVVATKRITVRAGEETRVTLEFPTISVASK